MIRSIADLQQMKEAYLEKMGQYTHLCMVLRYRMYVFRL